MDLAANPSRGSQRHSIWATPYGRVEASFWTVSNGFHLGPAGEDIDEATDKALAARVAIVPTRTVASSFRIVFDFTPRLDPLAKITYQAMIQNDSEVFDFVRNDQVTKLVEALQKGTASLNDRDEQGRSLLNVSLHEASIFRVISDARIVCCEL